MWIQNDYSCSHYKSPQLCEFERSVSIFEDNVAAEEKSIK